MTFRVALFAFVLCLPFVALAGERAQVSLVCLTETAILSLVDADRKGGTSLSRRP